MELYLGLLKYFNNTKKVCTYIDWFVLIVLISSFFIRVVLREKWLVKQCCWLSYVNLLWA